MAAHEHGRGVPWLAAGGASSADDPARRAALKRLAAAGLMPLGAQAWLARDAQAQPRPATRVALVVGNAAYPGTSALRNAGNDAAAMATQLARLGFEVVSARDASRGAMREAIARAGRLLEGQRGTGLIYYAGHGVQVDSRNFMLPVDDLPAKEIDVPRLAVDVSEAIDAFKRAGTKTNIVVLDACRDNPFAGTGADAGARGLAPLDAPSNTFLAYATAPGNVAEDGTAEGGNGLYTGFLLKELQRPGARIEDVFKRVRLGVRQASQGRQVPWESTSLEEDFFFDPTPPAPPPPRENEALALAEKATWERMRANARSEDLYAFLLVFPQGRFAEQAAFLLNQRAVALLRPVNAPPSTVAPQRTGDVRPVTATAPAPAPRPAPAFDPYGYGPPPPPPPPPRPPAAPPPAASAVAVGPAAPMVLAYRGERFRLGDACEWVVRDGSTGAERGRVEIRVAQVAGLGLRLESAMPAGIVRDAMGARLRDGFATYEDPVFDLPAEYTLGARWSGSARLRPHQGGSAVLDYRARVVGRQAIIIAGQGYEAWVVEAQGSATFDAAEPSAYACRLWALPHFGIPMRQELRLRPRRGTGPAQDEIVECTWVRLRA